MLDIVTFTSEEKTEKNKKILKYKKKEQKITKNFLKRKEKRKRKIKKKKRIKKKKIKKNKKKHGQR